MSDQARLSELQSALRAKMADNKAIADSFRVEDGTVIVSTQQKSAFDKNMQDIKEIKGLIEGLEAMNTVEQWGSQAPVESVAAAAAAGFSVKGVGNKSIGDLFIASPEFKALNGGRNGANMPTPFQVQSSLTTGIRVKDVYSELPSGTMGHNADAIFGAIQRRSEEHTSELQSH